ncbi:SH3 domain-containing protein [Microseira sp. BLCC-F43]|jgi:Bacterial SH3 domain|uniref:SH3 domain-containing protein n=1 Tax=Microseira sp. BLCC-F43 TaxID=3153602 RepID=UPI0035B87F28
MLQTTVLKTLITSTLMLSVALPIKAQVGPGLGPTDTARNSDVQSYARVCTNDTRNGRLSLRTGPGQQYPKIKEIRNGQTIGLIRGQYGSDGFYWWNVFHNGSRGWARADYICGDPQ